MQKDPELSRKSPPEKLFMHLMMHFFHLFSLKSSDMLVTSVILVVNSPEFKVPSDASVLEKAGICTCFSVADKELSLTDPWRRVIVRKVQQSIWELLDEFGKSVLDTIMQNGDKGVVEQWDKSIDDYTKAVLADEKQKVTAEERESIN